ncbi:MAG: hypothetical protein D6744_04590 [Planctomycetota bacterium]|nr:MAG: hypothetical protein D6744_04590 [Planctomycetota bacterium]
MFAARCGPTLAGGATTQARAGTQSERDSMSYPRFDEHSDHIVKKLAQEIAAEYGLDFVGTEHILLAILRHDHGVAAKALRRFGVDERRARETLDDIMKSDLEDTWVFGRLPGSPNYRNVVARAIEEATQLESPEIRPEHLLLALLHERGSTAQRVLAAMGVHMENCRAEVLRFLQHS